MTVTTIADILCIALAGFFKAVSDTLDHHFGRSVFRFKDPRFWNPEVSWKEANYLRFTNYKIDAWHISNSLIIICFACALSLDRPHIGFVWELIISGICYNFSFNIFYNKILLTKKPLS
jgi:hypothetical protein